MFAPLPGQLFASDRIECVGRVEFILGTTVQEVRLATEKDLILRDRPHMELDKLHPIIK